MSGTGKSAVVAELRRRGYVAYDADDDGYSEPAEGGAWRWRVEAVATLFASAATGVLFFAGCSDEQAAFEWDRKVLLTAPEQVILTRLGDRSSNPYGRSEEDKEQVVWDLREFELLLRRSADQIIDTTGPLTGVVDRILAAIEPSSINER
jgi:dephospho-CoA kinase